MGRTIVTTRDVHEAAVGGGAQREFNREFSPEELRQLIQDAEQEGDADKVEAYGKALENIEPRARTTVASSTATGVDSYVDRLLKYIPTESVVLYLTLQGIILSGAEDAPLPLWLWIIFLIGVVGTPMYL